MDVPRSLFLSGRGSPGSFFRNLFPIFHGRPLDGKLTGGTFAGIPINRFPAMRTTAGIILLPNPLFDSMGSQIFQLFDKPGVMGNPVDNMDREETPEARAGEVGALETPGHLVFLGAAAEAVAAIPARRIDVGGQAPVAADFFGRQARFLRSLFEIRRIVLPRGQVFRTGAAIDSANPDHLRYLFTLLFPHVSLPRRETGPPRGSC